MWKGALVVRLVQGTPLLSNHQELHPPLEGGGEQEPGAQSQELSVELHPVELPF